MAAFIPPASARLYPSRSRKKLLRASKAVEAEPLAKLDHQDRYADCWHASRSYGARQLCRALRRRHHHRVVRLKSVIFQLKRLIDTMRLPTGAIDGARHAARNGSPKA